jgi:hypothetical protein
MEVGIHPKKLNTPLKTRLIFHVNIIPLSICVIIFVI